MLRRGLELLQLNGQLVYSTTSLNPIENEAVVSALLKEAPGLLYLTVFYLHSLYIPYAATQSNTHSLYH